ncbi:unnamed protein product [Echinostoma caproni]|uniref:Methyltransferase n=1 Tax=Echinostoma caproni TaxID=27848 RepID=A0A183AEY8_9TREM|nr:unnamed protein product [Echinostoma caproni]
MEAEMDILMAMHLVTKAWMFVPPHELINAFMKAGFKFTLIQPVMEPPEDKCGHRNPGLKTVYEIHY